jgi:hypothetical protein
MQNLKGFSSGQNNKSCSIIHNGSKKIGFAFLRFFRDFLRNLQETGKWQHYWSYPFARRTLEKFLGLQCSPRGAVAGAAGQIPAARRGSWTGKGKGVI